MGPDGLTLPGTRHKVIGLVSGGKDSCFNLMHCEANGHEVIAIANLKPEPGVDELDSHLYQSVGTTMLPLMAQAMELPLFTRVIKGKAVERGPEYGQRHRGGEGSGTEGDETEDLTALLRQVMAAHPEATALSSGAILSNYQRLRIEHVCGRLGLVSLSYLWQQPQMPLLQSMLSSGIEAVLVKVAGVGLGVDLVGKQLGSIQPLLRRLEREYGSHPAGEGGEYETLTLSSPLFSHRLKLLKTKVVITDPEPYPVAYLQVEQAELERKEGWIRPTVQQLRDLLGLQAVNDGLDETSRNLLAELGHHKICESKAAELNYDLAKLEIIDQSEKAFGEARFHRRNRWYGVSVDGRTEGEEDIAAEIKRCFDSIKTKLDEYGLSLPVHSAHITLLLSSMSLFTSANAAYTTYFGTSPPSRATVAVPLPAGQRVKIEVLGFDDRPRPVSDAKAKTVGCRQALHVQGLSYWAPANIGPYSQAIVANSRLHVAGQIPLIPASLTLPPYPSSGVSPYSHQAMLALQHVRRILEVLRSKQSTGGGWSGWGESCVAWWARPDPSAGVGTGDEGVEVARKAWQLWAEENDWQRVPVLFVRAKELPRGALVEYQVNLHTGRRDVTEEAHEQEGQEFSLIPSASNEDDDGDNDEEDELEPLYRTEQGGSGLWSESCETSGKRKRGSRQIVFIRDQHTLDSATGSLKSSLVLARAVAVRLYHRANVDVERAILPVLERLWSGDRACLTFIPVLEIHDRHGQEADIALDVFGV